MDVPIQPAVKVIFSLVFCFSGLSALVHVPKPPIPNRQADPSRIGREVQTYHAPILQRP